MNLSPADLASFVAEPAHPLALRFCVQQGFDAGEPGGLGAAQGHRSAGHRGFHPSRMGGGTARQSVYGYWMASTSMEESALCRERRSVACTARVSRVRRVHMLALMPTLDAAEDFTGRLSKYGNLSSDGRPTVSLSARELSEPWRWTAIRRPWSYRLTPGLPGTGFMVPRAGSTAWTSALETWRT